MLTCMHKWERVQMLHPGRMNTAGEVHAGSCIIIHCAYVMETQGTIKSALHLGHTTAKHTVRGTRMLQQGIANRRLAASAAAGMCLDDQGRACLVVALATL